VLDTEFLLGIGKAGETVIMLLDIQHVLGDFAKDPAGEGLPAG